MYAYIIPALHLFSHLPEGLVPEYKLIVDPRHFIVPHRVALMDQRLQRIGRLTEGSRPSAGRRRTGHAGHRQFFIRRKYDLFTGAITQLYLYLAFDKRGLHDAVLLIRSHVEAGAQYPDGQPARM